MRRILVALGLLLVASVSNARAQRVEFGAKLGPGFATLAADPDDETGDYDRRIAAAGGAFLVLPLAPRVGVQIEGLYSPKGAKLFAEDLNLTSTLLLNYWDFPVLARVNPGSPAFHIFAGPYVGVRVSAKRQLSAAASGITSGQREDMSAEVERFDWGMVAGAGIQRGRRFVIDGRYSWGLADVNRDTSTGIRFRTRALTVLAGVRF